MGERQCTATWWARLGADTQDWLAENAAGPIPVDVADQIQAAGGWLSPPLLVASTGTVERLLPRFDREWIRENVDPWAHGAAGY